METFKQVQVQDMYDNLENYKFGVSEGAEQGLKESFNGLESALLDWGGMHAAGTLSAVPPDASDQNSSSDRIMFIDYGLAHAIVTATDYFPEYQKTLELDNMGYTGQVTKIVSDFGHGDFDKYLSFVHDVEEYMEKSSEIPIVKSAPNALVIDVSRDISISEGEAVPKMEHGTKKVKASSVKKESSVKLNKLKPLFPSMDFQSVYDNYEVENDCELDNDLG